MRKSIVVQTNDPEQPETTLHFGGKVNKFAEIKPRYARLAGDEGDPLQVDITIEPEPEYRFKIKKVKAKKNEHIRFNLTEPSEEHPNKYILRIENTKSDPGRYADAIQVHTDSKIQPVLTIGVYGFIRAKKASAAGNSVSRQKGAN